MKITDWTHWSNEDYIDTIDIDTNTFNTIEEAVIKGIRENGVKFCGGYHQNGRFGCPIIDDKYVYKTSFRNWGRIMAEALELPNEDGMAYCVWAWTTPSGQKPIYPGENNENN